VKDRFDQHLPRGNKVRGTKPTKKLGIIMVVLFCLIVGCHGKKAGKKVVTGLKAGEKKTISISTEGNNLMFKIAVPSSGIVTCHTTGTSTSGDADLYAKFASEPNTVSYGVKSDSGSSNEKVGPLKASTSARTLYVMVHAFTAFNNVQLWCDLTPSITQLTAGKKVTLSISTKGQNRMFKITVPKTNVITCYTTGSSSSKGDPDLYVKFITQPTLSSNNGVSKRASTVEVVGPLGASSTLDRTLYVMVHAFTAFNNVQLWCDMTKKTTAAATEAQISIQYE